MSESESESALVVITGGWSEFRVSTGAGGPRVVVDTTGWTMILSLLLPVLVAVLYGLFVFWTSAEGSALGSGWVSVG